ncbi:MAG: hypothetical protein VX589_02605 [Myxococcota bacterium]|nr:hypothetical protein [Myxococcota bacterium]
MDEGCAVSREPRPVNIDQLKHELESYERTTKAAYERLRAVVYTNKKELEAPIYQNKLELGRLGKRAKFLIAFVAVQMVVIGWLSWKNLRLNQEVTTLNTTFKDLEARSVRDLSRVEVAVEALRKKRKGITR